VVPRREPSGTSDDASYMRAMAVIVGRVGGSSHEALAIHNTRTVSPVCRVVPIEIANGVDAAIDDCDSDSRAVQGLLLPGPGAFTVSDV